MAAARATGVDVTVAAARGDSYRINVATHEPLATLGVKLGLEAIKF